MLRSPLLLKSVFTGDPEGDRLANPVVVWFSQFGYNVFAWDGQCQFLKHLEFNWTSLGSKFGSFLEHMPTNKRDGAGASVVV